MRRRTDSWIDLHVGILGGGQLARMLALKAHELGLRPHVLTLNSEDPAAQVTRFTQLGDPNNAREVAKFLRGVEAATFESEFISTPEHPHLKPSASVMLKLQDRLTQKQAMKDSGLKTLDFFELNPTVADLKSSQNLWPKGFVVKQRRYGYDGYGTFFIKSSANFESSLSKMQKAKGGFIAEPLVKFQRELAISAARSEDGSLAWLPLVETFQLDGRCLHVKGPVDHKGLNSLKRSIKKFMADLNYIGIMAFELFDLGSELVVNEIAPRVHNSAHYSLDGLSVDQFTLHWQAILGHSLTDPKPKAGGFAMWNLLGVNEPLIHPAKSSRFWPGHLHWYGKTEARPGRKMGHLNVLAASPERALAIAKKWGKSWPKS